MLLLYYSLIVFTLSLVLLQTRAQFPFNNSQQIFPQSPFQTGQLQQQQQFGPRPLLPQNPQQRFAILRNLNSIDWSTIDRREEEGTVIYTTFN